MWQPNECHVIVCHDLGPLEVTLEGKSPPPDLLWRKNIALLLYLAHSPHRTRTRDHIIGLLWPDKPEAKARRSLSEALSTLRRIGGSDIVEASTFELRLSATSVTVDSSSLEALVAGGSWNEIVETVRGEFLEGFVVPNANEFDGWLAAERLKWRQRCVAAFVAAGDAHLVSGDIGAAAEAGSRAIELEPGSDAAVQILIRALALGGNRSAALGVVDRFQTHLQGLGAGPDTETLRLVERVRRERSWLVEASTDAAEGHVRTAPLVGRSEALDQLLGAWASCKVQGRPNVCIIRGDPGMGKSRLAEEVIGRARLDGAAASATRGVQGDMGQPMSGVVGLLRGGLSHADGVAGCNPATIAAIAAVVPEWQEQFPGAKSNGDMPPLAQAFRDVVWTVGAEEPVVLFLDDAHWLDVESLRALESGVRDLSKTSVMVLITASTGHPRPEIDELQARIGRDYAGVVVLLGALGAPDIRKLVDMVVPSSDPDQSERLTRRVEVDSGGIPLLAVEVLHAVAAGLDLEDSDPDWPHEQRTLDDTLPSDLPGAVAGAIAVRFGLLTPSAQEALRVVAVADSPVKMGDITNVLDASKGEIERALDELEWERWLEADARGYSFVARIVRDIVLTNHVTAGQRLRIRETLGRYD